MTTTKTCVKKYKLYALDNYMKSKEFIKNGYKEYGIKSLIKELENDKGYHMRIHSTDNYTFFGDCDGFRGSFDEFANLFISFLDKYYDIKLQLDDFSHTINESKKGSYHYSVPRLYASAEKLKEIHMHFFEECKDILYVKETKTKIVDVSVYTEHWFRYPMQSKAGDKKAIHIIKKGSMIDFVAENKNKNSVCIDDKKYKMMNDKSKSVKEIKKSKTVKEVKKSKIITTVEKRGEGESMRFDTDNFVGLINEPFKKNNNVDALFVDSVNEDDNEKVDEMINEIVAEEAILSQRTCVDIVASKKGVKKELSDEQTCTNIKNHKIVMIDKTQGNEFKKNSFSFEEIECLLNLLSMERCDDYDQWIETGVCLYNIDKANLMLWRAWSMKSKKYTKGDCEKKWKSFSDNRDKKLTIGSLLFWCKNDNNTGYQEFIRNKKMIDLISTKYPEISLDVGSSYNVGKIEKHVILNNKDCLIYGDNHGTPTMYIQMLRDSMTIKCKHIECYGKIYPCEHILLTKNETNIVFNGDVHFNIGCETNTADIDDFEEITLFDTDKINQLVRKGFNGKSTPYSLIMYELYKGKYAYATDDTWYVYENHGWKLLEGYNTKMRKSINQDLEKMYTIVKNHYIEHGGKNSKQVKVIKQIITNFDDTRLINDIMTELKYTFLDENRDFLKKLNTDQNLIGFLNGVYDLKTHIFRDGRIDDYISMNVGYEYRDKYSINHKNLLMFLEDIQPNKSERDYLLTYISTALYGNTLELFSVLVGNGRNGKSKFISLLEKLFGDYYGRMNSQFLTSRMKEGDAPSPALLNLINKKIVVASESLNDTKLNGGFIKFITGRDTCEYRYCHQNEMIKFSPNFVTLLVCNEIPECDRMDNAFSKRMRCINFDTEFVEGTPISQNQKKMNKNINQFFDDWRQDLFLLLIEHYKKYENNNELLTPTDKILAWTNQYKEDTDIYFSFLNECTETSDVDTKTTDLYDIFGIWFEKQDFDYSVPALRTFSTGLKKYKNFVKKKFNKNENSTSGFRNIVIKKEHIIKKEDIATINQVQRI